MTCQGSKFLLVSLLTFLVGIGVVQFADNFLNLFLTPKVSQVAVVNETSSPIFKIDRPKFCEEIEGFRVHSIAKHTMTSITPLNSRAICLADTIYPPSALAVKAEGEVKVAVLIDVNGKVVSAKALFGHNLLRPLAVESAFKSKFCPQLLGGEFVNVKGILVYKFVLPNSKKIDF